jgi:ankyrin repeat protein
MVLFRPALLRLLLVALCAAALSAQGGTGDAALFTALQRGAIGDIERLLKGGANHNAVDAEGTPALMAATLFANAKAVELLLARGADPNRSDAAGATALMWAVPNLAKMRALLARGANVNAKSQTERTAFLVAASYPRSDGALRLLLEHGADVHAQDRAGATALSLAARSADIGVLSFLAGRGLDSGSLTPGARRVGLTRWDRATTDFLISQGLNPAPDVLVTTATWHPTALVDRWIGAGADVNAKNAAQYGRTPLLTAVTSERAGAETLTTLLNHGADPNTPTTEGETPLDWAVYKGDRAKIQVLEAHGGQRGNGPRREAIAPPTAGGIADPRVSMTKSTQQLLVAASAFKEKTSCISCHHNSLPAMVAATARRKGIDVDSQLASRNLDDMLTFFRSNAPRVMLGDPAVGGEALIVGYVQRALDASGYAPDKTTAAMTHWVLARQMPDGSWLGNGLNRPPSEYSLISHTAMAAGGLVAYPLAGRRDEVDEAVRRARQWLLAAQATSAEERGMRLMGLVWTKAPTARVDAAIREVRVAQEATGGWSQFGRTEPDAYATGLSLSALHIAGVPVTDEAYRKGVAYLLGSQYQDGTWLVRTHTFPVQRYFESGFPFGRHQWISAAGTSWATLAIANTLPDVPAARGVGVSQPSPPSRQAP